MKGNPRSSGYVKTEHEWYEEPRACVDALLDAEKFTGQILDPACGGGNIPKACRARGYDAAGSDIMDRGYGTPGRDFLKQDWLDDNILTNPPFSLAEQFVRHGLKCASRKVAIIQRLAFLESKGRKLMFESTPFARVWVCSSRVSMPPGGTDIPAKNGSMAYAWFVWEHGHTGAATIGFLP